ncbi:carbohydrate kinase family protein [Flavobacterium sp. TSSA_36]|uniref:carbohydrate kinase family protein n=1 Tax=Flavobacterium sp. TSSA_36 TaxID=3447669 RepID=UPI003F3A7D6A
MMSLPHAKSIVCFGEILFDIFPTHKKIGGAPLNVALRLASLGIHTQIISCIGTDSNGKEVIDMLSKTAISTQTIQVNSSYTTGEVQVHLDRKGSATYTINYPAAWDKIKYNQEGETAVIEADILVFGSLACRDIVSHQSLLNYIAVSKYKVFDVNLRPPFYSKELLIELLLEADFVKFNDDELYEICRFLNSPYHSLEQNIHFIAQKTNTKNICVTKGQHGAVLFFNDQMYYNSGYQVTVSDTVGAGDSFLAGLLSILFSENDPQKALNFACALGALVASHEGANPQISRKEINDFMHPSLQ